MYLQYHTLGRHTRTIAGISNFLLSSEVLTKNPACIVGFIASILEEILWSVNLLWIKSTRVSGLSCLVPIVVDIIICIWLVAIWWVGSYMVYFINTTKSANSLPVKFTTVVPLLSELIGP